MKDKKIVILFILAMTTSLIGIVGFTIAYFTSSTDFENEFQTGIYQTTATEVFESPQNWLPGDTEPKTLTITNTGNVDVKARVCLSEEWTSSSDEPLPNVVDGERMAIINLANTSDWTKKGNCYEYNDTLEPNDTTSSFIESVTFNPLAEADIECTTNGNTKECISTGNGYDNATYKLTLRVETVQADKASVVWPELIQYVNRQTEGEITVGDEVSIAGEHFYVMDTDLLETALVSKHNLLVGEVIDYTIDETTGNFTSVSSRKINSNDPGYGLQSENAIFSGSGTSFNIVGLVPFSGTNYWDNSVCQYSGLNYNCTGTPGLLSEYEINGVTDYDYVKPNIYNSQMRSIAPQTTLDTVTVISAGQNNGYTIAYYVEEYIDRLKSLGAPETISGRLLSLEEAEDIGYDNEINCPFLEGGEAVWFWLGSASDEDEVYYISYFNQVCNIDESSFALSSSGVRPVIEVPTSLLRLGGDYKVVYTADDTYSSKIGSPLNSNLDSYNTLEDVNKLFHIIHVLKNNIVVESYVEFIITNNDLVHNPGVVPGTYALRGGGATYNSLTDSYNNDSIYFIKNKTIAIVFLVLLSRGTVFILTLMEL